jgi:predicted DNA-binding transcriptional regulator AlpA
MRSAAPQRSFVEGDIAKHFGGTRSFINEKELADYLNMAAGSLALIRKAGLGPRCFRIGLRQIGYRPADVEAWLLARENATPTPTAPAVSVLAYA